MATDPKIRKENISKKKGSKLQEAKGSK